MDLLIAGMFSLACGTIGWGLGSRWTRRRMMRYDEWTGRFGS